MITDKNIGKINRSRRIFLRLMLLLLCCSLLCGCSNKMGGNAFEAIGEMMQTEAPDIKICEVVYGDDASPALMSAARELAESIGSQTGMDTVAHTYDGAYSDENIYLVLGRVEDARTVYIYNGMRAKDYICTTNEGITALGGVSDSATLEAIDEFCENVLPSAEGGRISHDGIAFEHTGEYEGERAMLNGYPLGDYAFFVDDTESREALEDFRNKISALTGDYPAIIMGECRRKDMYINVNTACQEERLVTLTAHGNKLNIDTDSLYGLYTQLDTLYSEISGGTQINIEGKRTQSYFDFRIKLACVEIFAASPISEVSNSIKASAADALAVRAENYEGWEMLVSYLGEAYSSRVIRQNTEGVLGVLYRQGGFEVTGADTRETESLTVAEITVKWSNTDISYTMLGLFGEDNGAVATVLASYSDCTAAVSLVKEKSTVGSVISGYNTQTDSVEIIGSERYRLYAHASNKIYCLGKPEYIMNSTHTLLGVEIGLKR